jgi:hypothetical protein
VIRWEWTLLSVLVALAASAGGGFWWGYSVRDGAAQRQALQSLQAAREAQQRATEAILAAGERYEALRAQIDAQRPSVERTIREIYRDVPTPAAECAVPDAGRRLLIDLGADGDAAPAGGAGD